MQGWETTVNSGNADYDRQTVEHYRAQAQSAGMQFQADPLAGGGFQVRATPAQPAAPSYGGGQPAYNQGAYGQPAYAGAGPSGGVNPVVVGNAGGSVVGTAASDATKPIAADRLVYLRKVYGLLGGACALAIAAGYVCISYGPLVKVRTSGGGRVKVPYVVGEMLNNPMLMYASFGALFVATMLASALSKVKVVNYIMLFLVAALMGLELAPMVYVAQHNAGVGVTLSSNPVRDAGLMTAGIFASITAYVFITKKDFSFLSAFLSMGVWIVFCACLLTFVFHSEIFVLAVATVGALLAAGFLLYQTSWILKHSDMTDPIDDALVFLVQIRNLFMFLLRIFMSRGD